MRKAFSHRFSLPMPPGRAIGFFTPKGEEDWVPGWAPRYLHPATGETRRDMLFTTGEGEALTFWCCLDWAPGEGLARYLRLTPASRVAVVEVRCAGAGAGSEVTVRYEMTALTEAGAAEIAAMTEAEFAAGIAEWPGLIASCAAAREGA